ncbi:MAG: DUF2490 domain-containing protein [Bacteroidota bacterium]|nr:DUF2490 domain-containing protein [Bacteroidota bacterium]
MNGCFRQLRWLLLIVLSGIGVKALAQNADFGLWSTIDLSKKLNNGLTFAFEEEYRLRNNLLTTDRFESTFEIDYKVNHYLETGASYTMINYFHPGNAKHDYQNYWELRNRFNVFAEGSYELGRFNLSLRERLQSTYRVLDSLSSAKINPKLNLRSKLGLSYNIPGLPLEPYASCEWFHLLNGETSFKFEQYRIGAGLKYKLSKSISVKAGYLYDAEVTGNEDGEHGNIMTVGLAYKF